MPCKHIRISLLKKSGERDGRGNAVQTARCRFKLTGEDLAIKIHSKLLEMGIEKAADPGVHCPFYPNSDYSTCPWYTHDKV
jgi:hypothetical protein